MSAFACEVCGGDVFPVSKRARKGTYGGDTCGTDTERDYLEFYLMTFRARVSVGYTVKQAKGSAEGDLFFRVADDLVMRGKTTDDAFAESRNFTHELVKTIEYAGEIPMPSTSFETTPTEKAAMLCLAVDNFYSRFDVFNANSLSDPEKEVVDAIRLSFRKLMRREIPKMPTIR
jgi:hypothetical protein